MTKTLAGLLACAAIFSLAPSPSAANRTYGEIQTDKFARQNQIGAKVNWSTSQAVPIATLFSDSVRFAAADVALIVGGTGEPIADDSYFLEFDFSRYLLDSSPLLPPDTPFFPRPLVAVEYFDSKSKSSVYQNLPFDNFQVTASTGNFEHAKLKVEKPANYAVRRVAVAAKADGASLSQFRVRALTINAPSRRESRLRDRTSLLVYIDKRALDPLLNVAIHSK